MAFTLPPLDFTTVSLTGSTMEAVVRELFDPLRNSSLVLDSKQAWIDLLARQAAGSVALDETVAVPHARTGAVKRLVIAGGRHVNGVPFDEKHQSVRLVFLILTPKERAAEYLRVLAALASRLRDPATRSRLLTAGTSDEFARLLEDRAAA